jgi:hypothetical protein
MTDEICAPDTALRRLSRTPAYASVASCAWLCARVMTPWLAANWEGWWFQDAGSRCVFASRGKVRATTAVRVWRPSLEKMLSMCLRTVPGEM